MAGQKKYKFFLLLLVASAISGCEKYILFVDAPVFKQKLAVTAFISPSDTISHVYVSSNQPIYGFFESEEDPGTVTGTISDGTTEIGLEHEGRDLWFRQDRMPIVPGKEYTLKISSSKGLHAEAVATIPQIHDFNISVDTVTIKHNELPGYAYTEFRISATFTDYPGETNYYSITGKFIGYKTDTGSQTEIYTERLWFEDSYFRDLKAGPDNKIKLETWISRSYHYYDSAFISVDLMNTEESYYLYHTSLDEFDMSDNPFSEAKPIYSNITGGLGIFTAYTPDSRLFRLK